MAVWRGKQRAADLQRAVDSDIAGTRKIRVGIREAVREAKAVYHLTEQAVVTQQVYVAV